MKTTFAVGTAGRCVGAQLGPGEDLIAGLKQVCREAGINSGAVVACAGSLSAVSFMYVQPREQAAASTGDPGSAARARLGFDYSPLQKVPGPLELVSVEGIILHTEGSGEITVHVHGLVVDQFGNVHGGHFVEGATPILSTAQVVIAETGNVRMVRKPDPERPGAMSLQPESVQPVSTGG